MDHAPADLTIRDFDRDGLADEAVDALVRLHDAKRAELRPDNPPPPLAVREADVRVPDTAGWRSHWSVAWRGDEAVGFAATDVDQQDNPDLAWLWAYVMPAHRRLGIGTALVEHALREAKRSLDPGPTQTGFDVLITTDIGRELQERFEKDWGLSVGIVGREARLDLASVDAARIEAAHARRLAGLEGGYQLHFFENLDVPGPSTGFELDDFCATYEKIMNLMPLEDLKLEHERFPPERWRSMVTRLTSTGRQIWYLVCCEPDGHVVGLTAVAVTDADPRLVEQWDTGVLAEAQGNGIGSALKLDMLLRILDRLPEAQYIDTDNAYSNAPMIAINSALGFEEHRISHVYQLPVARLRELLGVSERADGNR